MIVISDSSPLISLSIISGLDLLEKLYNEIIVPEAVYEEVSLTDKPFSGSLQQYLKGKIRSVKNRVAVEMLQCDLGKGEAEAIILALETKPDFLLIDDLKARKLAGLNGIKIKGTMGVLLEGKKRGLIEEIKPLISLLISSNIRISETIIEMTLKAAGEI